MAEKIEIALAWIFGIGLFFAYRIGLQIGDKWLYVLVLAFGENWSNDWMKDQSIIVILLWVFAFLGSSVDLQAGFTKEDSGNLRMGR